MFNLQAKRVAALSNLVFLHLDF